MTILVDYYNLRSELKDLTLRDLSNLFIANIPPQNLSSLRKITIRLYGGWFEGQLITRKAQQLANEIEGSFPDVYTDMASNNRIIVNTEMAYSLICNSSNHLFHTYRTRAVYYGLKVKNSADLGCTDPNCPFEILSQMLSKNRCLICNKPDVQSHFYRSEQKLVDTMLSSDIIFLSFQKMPLLIITTDDDFWPAIRTGVSLGGQIIHIETKNHKRDFDYSFLFEKNETYTNIKI